MLHHQPPRCGFVGTGQLLLLLPALLLQLLWAPPVASVAFKVAVVIEAGSINRSLIDHAFNRRVASNWRLLSGHSFTPVVLDAASSCSITMATRLLCEQTGLSGVIAAGRCGFLAQLRSAAASAGLPMIGLPTGLCWDAGDAVSLTGSHSASQVAAAAAETMAVKAAGSVALLFDSWQDPAVLQSLQISLTNRGISFISLQIDDAASTGALRPDLAGQLTGLMKKRLRHAVMLVEPGNALAVLSQANASQLLAQNYFWLLLDTGLTTGQLKPLLPVNANAALVRGAGPSGPCTGAVRDAFDTCDADWVRTLDVRFVDAVEAMAKALNDSVSEGGFAASNATCGSPLRAWSSGPSVTSKLASLTGYDTGRGVIGYNSTSRHFDSQGIEIVGSYHEVRSSLLQFVLSGLFNTQTAALTKQFRIRGESLIFPNTFIGFKNETLVVCSPVYPPFTYYNTAVNPDNTVIIGGFLRDILDIMAEKMEFKYITKTPDDGQWGAPQAGKSYFTGCVGEVQRDVVQLGGGPFVKTTTRFNVIDYGPPVFQESTAILLPKPPPKTKLWNVFTSFNYKLEYSIADEVWLQEYLWSILGSFFQQGQDFYPFAASPRAVMAFWWMFSVIFLGAYTGDLTAHLTITVTDLPIKSLEDMVSQTAIKPLVPIGTNHYSLLMESTSGIYRKLGDMSTVVSSTTECSTKVFTDNAACIGSYSYLVNFARANCSQVYMAAEVFNTASAALIYAKDAYFAEPFDYYFAKLSETGVLDKLFNKYWTSDSVCTVGNSAEADPITLEGTGGCFIVTLGLYCVGLLLLGLELVWTRGFGKAPLDCVLY